MTNDAPEFDQAEEPAPRTPAWWQRLLYGKRPLRTLLRLGIEVALCVFLFKYVLVPIRVQGISMLPAYKNGAINFLHNKRFSWTPLQRGDVVGIYYRGKSVLLLKRIIALPGERVAIHRSRVSINGELLPEPYVKLPKALWEVQNLTLASGEYFVIGDNRQMAMDDHEFGIVDEERILGKVIY